MFWFNGSINEAINKSKAERKVFVVFINGSDDISRKMETLYQSLADKLSELPIVAIKLDSQSENCKLFSQIYPVILIPSTYFIDYNGVAIEIIGGSVEDQNVLLEKINKTIEVYKQSLPSDVLKSDENQTTETKTETNTSADSQEMDATTSGASSAVNTTPETPNVTEASNLEEKVKRANDLIEALREKKAKEEAEREREAETERRKAMKEMQKSKRLREDKEAMEVVKEREREKKEEKMARERVLAQIAADREERKRRRMEFTDSESKGQTSSHNENNENVRQRVVADKTRIQFRLPDGSTANHIFESKDLLSTVGQYVSSQLNVNNFVLSTTFPRKEFSDIEFGKTLEELSLCPSSVLLVIPRNSSNTSGAIVSQSIFWQLATYLSLPFVMIWNLLTSFFQPNQRMDTNTEETDRRVPQRRDQKTFYKRDGNIARLRGDKEDEDDDNNTWNGNSTQQM